MQNKSKINPETLPQLSLIQIFLLHLLPGVLLTGLFIILAPFLEIFGFQSSLTFILLGLSFLVPFELAIMFYVSRKSNLKHPSKQIVFYREAIGRGQFVLLGLVLLILALVVFNGLYAPIAEFLKDSFFGWLPTWFFLDPSVLKNSYMKSTLIFVALLNVLFTIIGPIIEEVYFRGFLLPRMSSYQEKGPLFSATLHASYHLWLPWNIIGYIIILLPGTFIAWKKKNIYITMVVHVLGNVIGSVSFLIAVLALAG